MSPTGSELRLPSLSGHQELVVVQRVEPLEVVIGAETRNKYSLHAADGAPVGYAAEQGKGLGGALLRLLVQHWRTFDIHLFARDRELVAVAHHPFRFFGWNERLELVDARGTPLGAIQRRFSVFSKRLDVISATTGDVLRVSSPLWRVWTFELMGADGRRATIEKKWSGAVKEIFTDADTFRILFDDRALDDGMRWLLVAAAIFIDLQWFEDNDATASNLLGSE